ncbi:hypothetical protein [Streptomonospora wellingtoniae]|uniref:Uncharacterized protein n=1 Tax=Streptomonospora wellingtoniae TaxID=3075544 RepID=A0ABU2KZH2_9ACTN|nr:hypothetical protein [Streptomonospora sp. DSM 45055]MDT0304709.1 hypothetical protein [Streptomonospora sp. DSM 45055]
MNAPNPYSSDSTDSSDLFSAIPEEVARKGNELYWPADAIDELITRYETFRGQLDPLWGTDEFSQKMEKNVTPMEGDMMYYLRTLSEGVRTCADYTLETARSFQVVDESANETGKDLKSSIGDRTGGGGGGTGGRR